MKTLITLSQQIKKKTRKEIELLEFEKETETGKKEELYSWDKNYYREIVQQRKTAYSSKEISGYFSLGGCMEGISILVNRLYGLKIQVEEVGEGEVWHESVYKLGVYEENNELIGYIYADLFARDGKLDMPSHFTIQSFNFIFYIFISLYIYF